MIYLDANATTPIHPSVREAVLPFLTEQFGNPSSLHPPGQAVRAAIELARRQVAALLGCRPPEVVFTSGGTEANNLALCGALRSAPPGRRKLVTCAGEHPSVLATALALAAAGSCELEVVGLDRNGVVDEGAALAAIDESTALVSIQGANSEVGTLQPLSRIAARCREVGSLMHVDAVQMAGKVPCAVADLGGADLVSISAHKAHGPKGVGALHIRKGVTLEPMLHGGGQEARIRPGTENVIGIVGMGACCDLALTQLLPHAAAVRELRDRLEAGILDRVECASVHAAGVARVGNTTSICFRGLQGSALMVALGADGIAASMGSACSSGDIRPSPVLLAMGVGERDASSTLRFSLSASTTAAEVDEALERIPRTALRLQGLSRGRGGPPRTHPI